jgi:hypothetical protein
LWAIKWMYGLNDYQVASDRPDWLNAFETYASVKAPIEIFVIDRVERASGN